jgi:hypothetical protein
MANASSEVLIPNVVYQDGGRQNFSEKFGHVKYNGSISLAIDDFLAWSETKKDKFSFKSSPFEFVCDQKTYTFKIDIMLNNKTDDDIGVYLRKSNPEEVNIFYELMALDSSGNSLKKKQLIKKLSFDGPGWGSKVFCPRET